MFSLKHRQLAADGLVRCPVRGEDIDLECCLACPHVRSVKVVPGTRTITEVNCVTADRLIDRLLGVPLG